MRRAGKLSPEEFWARQEQGAARMRAGAGELPLFGVDGWTGVRLVSNWDRQDDQLVGVGLAHGDRLGGETFVLVQTVTGDPVRTVVLLRSSARPRPAERDEFWELHKSLAEEPGTPVELAVDGVACRFQQWTEGAGWLAAGRHGAYGVVVEASADVRAEDLRLVPVTDLEPYLAGRRSYLRRKRGEDEG